MEFLFIFLGTALIIGALFQFAFWAGQGIRFHAFEKERQEAELQLLREQLYEIASRSPSASEQSFEPASSNEPQQTPSPKATASVPAPASPSPGFKEFIVDQLVKETETCTSVYLKPRDGLPLSEYLPGQHITLRFPIPGHPKPVVRCYTLSDSSNPDYYRISVKMALPPANIAEAKPGVVSSFVNQQLSEGQSLQVKSPSGSFYLQPGETPVVLLAGGVGITPMMSMINTLVQQNSNRHVLLMYGVNHGADHIFKQHLERVAQTYPNIKVINCYSQPNAKDKPNQDFQAQGFVSIDLLKKVLPTPDFDFYLCGPPPFMESLYQGLSDWGVPEKRIRYEAFGPASIKKSRSSSPSSESAATQNTASTESASFSITFQQANQTATWDGRQENLLDFVEHHDVSIDSGCRAGSCGTCATRLLKGQVRYLDDHLADCEPGWCLPCVCVPTEETILDL